MKTIELNELKKELYTAVLKTVREKMDTPTAKDLIKEQLDKQLLERTVNPNVGLLVDKIV